MRGCASGFNIRNVGTPAARQAHAVNKLTGICAMGEAEMMRRGAKEANEFSAQQAARISRDRQTDLLEEIRDLLKLLVKPDQIDPRFRR